MKPVTQARWTIRRLNADRNVLNRRVVELQHQITKLKRALAATNDLMVRPAHLATCGAYRNNVTGRMDYSGTCTCGVDARAAANRELLQ